MIQAPVGQRIKLHFPAFQTQTDADYVKVTLASLRSLNARSRACHAQVFALNTTQPRFAQLEALWNTSTLLIEGKLNELPNINSQLASTITDGYIAEVISGVLPDLSSNFQGTLRTTPEANAVVVQLTSDSAISGEGFIAEYSALPLVDGTLSDPLSLQWRE